MKKSITYKKVEREVKNRHGLKCHCVAEKWHLTASWPHQKL